MAQLVARFHGMEEVRGSNPLSSTSTQRDKAYGVAVLKILFRVVGIRALAEVGHRLPFVFTRRLTGILLVLSNLMPLFAVARGAAGPFDVFGFFLMEAVALWGFTTLRILTATGRGQATGSGFLVPNSRIDVDDSRQVALFFGWHFGIFVMLSLVTTVILARHAGATPAPPTYWITLLTALVIIHTLDIGLYWFGQDMCSRTSPGSAMVAPYPAILTLYTAAMFCIGLVLAFGHAGGVAAVAILCGLKAIVDFIARFAMVPPTVPAS